MKHMARAGCFWCFLALLLMVGLSPRAAEFDLAKCKADFIAGEYEKVIEQAGAAVKERERGEDWALLYAHALWMTGKYPQAREAIKNAQRFSYYSVRSRLLGHKLSRSAGELEEAGGG